MWGKHLVEIVALLRETNGLLREILRAQGRTPLTPQHDQPKGPPRGASAVMQVTRQDVLEMERKAQEAIDAPWRSGPGNAPTAPSAGNGSNPPTA